MKRRRNLIIASACAALVAIAGAAFWWARPSGSETSATATAKFFTVRADNVTVVTVLGLSLTFPSGSVHRDTELRVAEDEVPPDAAFDAEAPEVSQAFSLSLTDGSQPLKSVSIRLTVQKITRPDAVFLGTYDDVRGWRQVPRATFDAGTHIISAQLSHFSTYQARQTDPETVTADMKRRFGGLLERAKRLPVPIADTCSTVSGFAVAVNDSAANDEPIRACLSVRDDKLQADINNQFYSGVILSKIDAKVSRDIGPVGLSDRAAEFVAGLNGPGSTYLPGGATATLLLEPDASFPINVDLSLDSAALTFNVAFLAVTETYKLADLAANAQVFNCVDSVAHAKKGNLGESLLACFNIPDEKQFPLWHDQIIDGINLALDGIPQRFGEAVRSLAKGSHWRVTVRRTNEGLPPALASIYDRIVQYGSLGYRYRVTLHFGQVRFVTQNTCDHTQAAEGVRFLELPYTLQSLSNDRYIPPVAPRLWLTDVKARARATYYSPSILDPMNISIGSPPESCVILHGDYSREQRGMLPNGAMQGVYVEYQDHGSIRENDEFDGYYVSFLTAFSQIVPDGGQALVWTLAGRPVKEVP